MNNGTADVESLIKSIYSEEQVSEGKIPDDSSANPPAGDPPAGDPPAGDPPTTPPATPPSGDAPVEVSLGDDPAVQATPTPELDTLISSDPDFQALGVPITDKAQLIEMAKGYVDLLDQVESLKQQLSTPPSAEFKTESAKKLASFLESFPEEEEGVVEFGRILALRPGKMTDDEVLMEAFLHENKDLTPEKARLFFNKRELAKYLAADEEDKEEQEILDIQKSRDAAKARQYLSKLKEDIKPSKAVVVQKDAPDPVFITNSTSNIATIEKSLADFSTFVVEDPSKLSPPIKISLTPEQQEMVKKECISAVSMRSSYDEKGVFKYHLQPKEMANSAALALFGKKILEITGSQRYKDGFAAAIKERSAVAPDRVVSGMPVEQKKEPTTIPEIYESLANGKQ